MSASNIAGLVDRIQQSAALSLLFQRLWAPSGVECRSLFLAHRELLFPHQVEGSHRLTIPCLFAGTDPEPEDERLLVAAGEARDARRDTFVRSREPKESNFDQDLKTTLCLLALRFVDRNPGLRALLDVGPPTFASVSKLISATPPSLEIFDEFVGDSSGDRVLDGALRDKILGYSTAFKAFLREGDFMEFATTFDLSLQLWPFLPACREQLFTLLEARGLEYEGYQSILADLYRDRLISNVGTIFWCVRCQDDVTIVTTQSRVSPTHLKMKCMKCQRAMAAGALYQLDGLLRECLFSNDGLLGVGVGWLLKKHGTAFTAEGYVQDQELDFRFRLRDEEVLVECKMHKTNRDAEATIQHLVTDISQAAKHAGVVRKSGATLNTTWIVTNYDLASIAEEVRAAQSRCREKVEAYSIEIVDAGDLPRRLEGGRTLTRK